MQYSGDMRLLIAFAASMLLAACSYTGPPETIADYRATIFSYMRADDVRAACEAGGGDHYRYVYNAPVDGERRSIDVVASSGGGGTLTEVIDRGLTLSGGTQFSTIANIPRDFLAVPRQERLVDATEVAALKIAMAEDGVFGPPPVGRVLRSRDNWWLVAGCNEGAFFLTGYVLPGNQPDPLQFAALLRALDPTGIPWPPPRRFVSPRDRSGTCALDNASVEPCFVLNIGEDGIIGHRPFL
ncbi:MAG: hypothetical protein AAF414_09870 [Pseudomonadota bacterium]